MRFDIVEYYKMLSSNNLDVIYSGPLWASGVEGIAETLKRRLAFDDMPLPASQAVFSVFIEQINNMLMYSTDKRLVEESDGEHRSVPNGAFALGVCGKKYFLQSGNLIATEDAGYLKEKIDYLNTLDKKQLRQYYKECIKKENDNPNSKGAGLGMIEIARRASSKIEYDFSPFDNGRSFFSLYVEIG